MSQILLVLVVALTVGAIVFGIIVLFGGEDGGLRPAEPDGRAVPLPADRPLVEGDLAQVRFDLALRGYRMGQVDAALRRAAYDVGYKDELVRVLQAEVEALREGRHADAEVLRKAREDALTPAAPLADAPPGRLPDQPDQPDPPAEQAAAPPEQAAGPPARPDEPADAEPESEVPEPEVPEPEVPELAVADEVAGVAGERRR